MAFFQFCQTFAKLLAYLLIFQYFTMPLVIGAPHFEKPPNIPKIWQKIKKSLAQLTFLTPFLYGTIKTQN